MIVEDICEVNRNDAFSLHDSGKKPYRRFQYSGSIASTNSLSGHSLQNEPSQHTSTKSGYGGAKRGTGQASIDIKFWTTHFCSINSGSFVNALMCTPNVQWPSCMPIVQLLELVQCEQTQSANAEKRKKSMIIML